MKNYLAFIENYLGVTKFIIIFLILISSFSIFIRCKRKKMVYRIRYNFFILLIASIVVLYFAKKIGLPYEEVYATDTQLKEFVRIALYKYNIGLFFTFVLEWIYTKVPGMYIYIASIASIVISLFFLVAKMIRVSITTLVRNIKEKNRLKREKKLIQEQIALKEFYEKLAREEELRHQKEKEIAQELEEELRALEEKEKEEEKQVTALVLVETEENKEEKVEEIAKEATEEIEIEETVEEVQEEVLEEKVEEEITEEEKIEEGNE